MKKKQSLFIIILIFILLMVGAYFLYGRLSQTVDSEQLAVREETQTEDGSEAETGEEEKVQAPDFTVYDPEGNEVRLSDYIGKPVVLNFWASWCGPCQREMPDFNEASEELGEEVQFLMVNMTNGRETLESASSFIEEKSYTFSVFYDTDGDAAEVYSVYSLPTTYFIDEEGYVIAQATGAIDRDTLQKGIEMIMPQ